MTSLAIDPADTRRVIGLDWDSFLAYMRWAWKPGQHIALIGPTGEGKTTFATWLLLLRKWVIALDPKGEDDTLSASGFVRVGALPGDIDLTFRLQHWQAARQWDAIHQAIAEDRPARLIIGGATRTVAQDLANMHLMHRTIEYCREAGGWTLFADEFEVLSSLQMYKLAPQFNRMLITARKDGTSVMTAYQAQAWVSKHATRQARLAVIWPTGDRDMIKAIAQSMGRDWRDLAAAVDELPAWHVLVVPRGKSGGPFICTSAPPLPAAA